MDATSRSNYTSNTADKSRKRKRKNCPNCGEDYSHSAYYRHKRFCKKDDKHTDNLSFEVDLIQKSCHEANKNDCELLSSSSSSFSLGTPNEDSTERETLDSNQLEQDSADLDTHEG